MYAFDYDYPIEEFPEREPREFTHKGLPVPCKFSQSVIDTLATLEKYNVARWKEIHEDILEKRPLGEGAALIETEEIKTWAEIDSPTKFIWATGKAGIGKTYLTSFLLEWLNKDLKTRPKVAVITVYLRHAEKLTEADIVLGVITQLVEWSEGIPTVHALIEDVFSKPRIRGAKPTLIELVKLLKAVLAEFTEPRIVIDGLNEAKPEVQDFIVELFSSLDIYVLFITVPSERHEEKVKALKGDKAIFTTIDTQPQVLYDHIDRHIRRRTPGIGKLLDMHKNWDLIITWLRDKADGQFYHGTLQVEMLQFCLNLRGIKEVHAKTSENLADVYVDVLRKSYKLPDEFGHYAVHALNWILHGARNFTVDEMHHVTALDPATLSYDRDRTVADEHLLNVGCSLTTVEIWRNREYHLIASSSYLMIPEPLKTYLPNAHGAIARVSLRRLLDHDFNHAKFETLGQLKAFYAAEDNLLIDYQAEFIGYHAQRGYHSNEPFQTEIKKFIDTSTSFPYLPEKELYDDDTALHLLQPLHLASLCNLPDLTTLIIMRDHPDVNEKAKRSKGEGLTALQIAAIEGSSWSMRVLLSTEDIEVNLVDDRGDTPLVNAAKRGHVDIVKQLLAFPGISINQAAQDGYSALVAAATNDYPEVVKLLLAAPGIETAGLEDAALYALPPLERIKAVGLI